VPEQEIIEYALAAVRNKADYARVLHYDYRYMAQRIKAFRKREAWRKANGDRQ
jgi:hypothetical protein